MNYFKCVKRVEKSFGKRLTGLAKLTRSEPAWTLPQNLDLLTRPMRLPEMARMMTKIITSGKTATPVDQPPTLLLDTVTLG